MLSNKHISFSILHMSSLHSPLLPLPYTLLQCLKDVDIRICIITKVCTANYKIFLKWLKHIQAIPHMINHKTKKFWRLYMSDLTATGCGCATTNNNNGFGCSSLIWIILLLSCCGGCGGNGGFFGGNSDNSCGCDLIWIILLLFCCGNNNGGCGCGC